MSTLAITEVRVSQAQLCVTDVGINVGRGPAVIFLHAGVADRRMWAAQQVHLQERYRTIAYDRRGFGGTTAAPEQFSQVGDLIGLMDALALHSAVLVGCSMGGGIAMNTALAYPRRVRALVILCSAPGATERAPQHSTFVQARLEALAAAELANDLAAINDIEARIWLDGPEQPTGRVSGDARSLFLEMNGLALRAPTLSDEVRAPAMIGRLHGVDVPVLLLAGEYDFAGINTAMQAIATQLPRARYHCIAGCAHLPSLELPEVVNDALDHFLQSL